MGIDWEIDWDVVKVWCVIFGAMGFVFMGLQVQEEIKTKKAEKQSRELQKQREMQLRFIERYKDMTGKTLGPDEVTKIMQYLKNQKTK